MPKHLCIDFDGVIHSYDSGWKGADRVDDPPVEGAIEWLTELVESSRYVVNIYSSRSSKEGGIEAMIRFLWDNGIEENVLIQIEFPTQKPPAFLTIDDRAICFNGTFPTQDEIDTFVPWNKKGD